MEDSSIADFLPMYSIKGIQGDITHRKEFYDLKLKPKEETPKEVGGLFNAQIITKRLLSPYTVNDRLLLYWEMGAGKTRAVLAVAESFKNAIDNPKIRASLKNNVLILVGSELIARVFKAELAEAYPEKYAPKEGEEVKEEKVETSERAYTVRLGKNIRRNYDIQSYRTFLKLVYNKPDYVRREYSNRLIIIDEVHNLRIQDKKKRIGFKESFYTQMHWFLHNVTKSKIILLTGTPIRDRTNEIASIMNLILPLDNQMPVDVGFDQRYFNEEGRLLNRDELIDFFRDRVSYVRQIVNSKKVLHGHVNPWNDGEYDEWNRIASQEGFDVGEGSYPWLRYVKVYPSLMSAEQNLAVYKASKERVGKTGKAGGVAERLARDASNFIYPDGSYGTAGFFVYAAQKVKRKVKKKIKGKIAVVEREVEIYRLRVQSFRNHVRNITRLRKLSTKFATIIEFIRSNPDKPIFVYTHDFVKNGGAILLSLILKEMGFEEVTGKNVLNPDRVKRRFGVITHVSRFDPSKLIEQFNRTDNSKGDIIQIIIGSEKISEGISIKNIRQIHVLSIYWNLSTVEQALMRAIRVTSHIHLPPEERSVDIYYHVAVARLSYDVDSPGYNMASPEITIDIHSLQTAEAKSFRDHQVYRLMRIASIDCALAYARNVLPLDEDFSVECNYDDCNYVCDMIKPSDTNKKVYKYEIPESEIVRETYNVYYADADVKDIIDRVGLVFRKRFIISLDELYQIIGGDGKLLLKALDQLIDQRLPLIDSYGFQVYLKEKNDYYYLDKLIAPGTVSDSIYTKYPMVTEKINLGDLVEINQLLSDRENIELLCRADIGKVDDIIKNLKYKTKVVVLETFYDIYARSKDQKAKAIVDIFRSYLYTVKEGIVIHTMYSKEYTGTSYNVAAFPLKDTGTMRCYVKGEWRYCTKQEEEEWTKIIKVKTKEKKEKTITESPWGFFGTISSLDKKFRIVDRKKVGGGETRGNVCGTGRFNKAGVINLLVKVGYKPDIGKKYVNIENPDELRGLIMRQRGASKLEGVDRMDVNTLKLVATMYSMNLGNLCRSLKEFLQQNGLLINV